MYVSQRHKIAHYRGVAEDMQALIHGADAHVLDYGSGEALFAEDVAARCSRLYLLDGAERVRRGLSTRLGHTDKLVVLSPEEIENIPDQSLDLAVMNSLLQYLSPEERDRVLAVLRRKLKPAGELVVADVIPRQLGALPDARALITFAARERFMVAALMGLVRTYFSSYRTTRAQLGLARYDAPEMLSVLARAGFSARRAASNVGHNPFRMTFVAQPSNLTADLAAEKAA